MGFRHSRLHTSSNSSVAEISTYRQLSEQRKRQDNVKQVKSLDDETEREKLILENRSTARKMGRAILNRWGCQMEAEEIHSSVDLALCEAARCFNLKHGASFLTYLFFFLKGKLSKSMKELSWKEIPYESSNDGASARGMSSIESLYEDARESNPEVPQVLTPEEIVAARQLKERCFKVLSNLSAVERSVVVQSGANGEKMNGLAEKLGYSKGHLFSIRKSAFESIKGKLDDFREAA